MQQCVVTSRSEAQKYPEEQTSDTAASSRSETLLTILREFWSHTITRRTSPKPKMKDYKLITQIYSKTLVRNKELRISLLKKMISDTHEESWSNIITRALVRLQIKRSLCRVREMPFPNWESILDKPINLMRMMIRLPINMNGHPIGLIHLDGNTNNEEHSTSFWINQIKSISLEGSVLIKV